MEKRTHTPSLFTLRSPVFGKIRIIQILVTLAVSQAGKAAPPASETTRLGGEYEYVDGAYRRPTDLLINGSLDTLSAAGDTVAQAQHFLNNATSFGLRTEFSPGTGGAAVNGGLGLTLQGPMLLGDNIGLTPQRQRNIWSEMRLGPLYIDNVYGGVGAIYSDYQGISPIGGLGFHDGGDNWAGIVWASARATTYITNRFALSLNPSIYYLPLTNKIGWAVGSPFLGLGNGQFRPNAILQMAYRVPMEGGYELVFSDWFGAYYLANTLLNQSMFFQTALGDTTPVDYAGRYPTPYGLGGYQTTTTSSTSFSVSDTQFDQKRMYFQNWTSVRLNGQHGDHIRSSIYFNRTDFWDYDFNHSPGWNNLGAVIIQQGPVLSPYAFYQLSTQDDFRSRYNQAVVGTNAQLSPNLLAYAQAGVLWGEQRLPAGGASNSYSTWIAQTGFRQRLGPYTLHGLDAGRNILGGVGGAANAQFISNFVRYYATQQLGLRTAASLYAEKADMTLVGGGGASTSDREIVTVGAMIQSQLSAKSSLSLFASYDQVHMTQIARGWDMWTYRAAYTRQIGVSVQGMINYQYQQVGSGVSASDASFQEHFLFMGLSKRF